MERMVILTGAGISRESGLDTFRDEGGIWSRIRLEDVCTPEGFARDPDTVDDFYNKRRRELSTAEPNAAHRALADLEAAYGNMTDDAFLLITQNIDDLHERAGSENLVHIHGELLRLRCLNCGATPLWATDCQRNTPCPACGQPHLRPDVVWFGELPLHMERIQRALERCEVFVAIGTSATVYPAAGFVDEVSGQARTVELNLVPSGNAGLFDEVSYGEATTIVPRFVRDYLAENLL
ncbi:NAD-dependent deacylase [Acetobacter fallax]|uniref:NAD-dependent protein deacylase n=1 Tax=Acetobacter fallax TaxID=1737473 RepID=A0ABX0K436_9PROT|nr:NAD-dependent deacylase [Acetobacter fallax]NHO31099.1 NAD-dependent protein deacylase [Acetobacter fallax]NHO34656.1 NAD-dependent protein deacylase [Acetobacter fallax]